MNGRRENVSSSCLELVLAKERENRRRKSRTLVEIDRAKEEAGGARGVAPRRKERRKPSLLTAIHPTLAYPRGVRKPRKN